MDRTATLVVCLAVLVVPALQAIETDQYYSWGRPLEDSLEVMNAKVNLEIDRALAQTNQQRRDPGMTCSAVRKRIVNHFRLLLIHRLELWAVNSALVERIPATAEEELRYRKVFLYHDRHPLDPAVLMAPSLTIQVDDVRFGTDKLTHFFSEGWMYYKSYRKGRRSGLSHEEAELKAIDMGAFTERTILGLATSGVFSRADLEANYQGLRFMTALCDPVQPLLIRTDEGWQLREPFDFHDYITPEWDESWQSSIIGRFRWKRIRPVLEGYCAILDTPEVRAQRQRYASRDRVTATERRIQELVDEGKLADPRDYSIEQVCAGRDRQGLFRNDSAPSLSIDDLKVGNTVGPLDFLYHRHRPASRGRRVSPRGPGRLDHQ